jgi:hypothetical protein
MKRGPGKPPLDLTPEQRRQRRLNQMKNFKRSRRNLCPCGRKAVAFKMGHVCAECLAIEDTNEHHFAGRRLQQEQIDRKYFDTFATGLRFA